MSLFAGKPEDTESDLSKLLAPTFTQTDNDGVRDFPAFVAHIRSLREMSLKVTLTVTHFLRDGALVADRHSSSTIMPDGTVSKGETYMFGGVAEDGRLEWVSEVVIDERENN